MILLHYFFLFILSKHSYGFIIQPHAATAGVVDAKRSNRSSFLTAASHQRSFSFHADDSPEAAKVLPLTASDYDRLLSLQQQKTQIMPILILKDSILPKQRIVLSSADPTFAALMQHAVTGTQKIAVLGLNPYTGRPVSHGVTVTVTPQTLSIDKKTNVVTWTAIGRRERIQVQGEPWMSDHGGFYLAKVDIQQEKQDKPPHVEITKQQQENARVLSKRLQSMVHEWKHWVQVKQATTEAALSTIFKDIGREMPENLTDRAFWVGALINPSVAAASTTTSSVCLEIRPALLACRNDWERMVLVTQALQSSIDHLSGKQRLF